MIKDPNFAKRVQKQSLHALGCTQPCGETPALDSTCGGGVLGRKTSLLRYSQLKDYPDWLSEEAIDTLNNKYLQPNETPKDAYLHIATKAAEYLNRPDLIEDIFTCLYNGRIGTASAFFSNFGREEGLPISCNSIFIPDSILGIYHKGLSEMAVLSQNGAGVAAWVGDIRASGSSIRKDKGKSVGILPVAKLIDVTGNYVSQNAKRPGAVAIWLDIEHKDVPELLLAKDHLQGDVRKHLDCNLGLTVSDEFMNRVLAADKKATDLWSKVLITQLKTGSPYLMFIDTANRALPQGYKNNNLTLKGSNICCEIQLYLDTLHTFVCCLCSLNLSTWFEWKDWRGVSGKSVPELAVYLLEAGLDDYIAKASAIPLLENAIRSVLKERAIGVGVMGLHYLYQSLGYPFKSYDARELNKEIHKFISKMTHKASVDLGKERGVPEWSYGRRHSMTTAIAPTRTNSVISGAYSAGIEPNDSNYYVAKQNKGNFVRKNKFLEKLLESKGKNTPEIWESIGKHNGSVVHLNFLSFDEKHVFFTAREIDQLELIRQASERQLFIDQSQSLNRFIHPDTPVRIINEQIFSAWLNGVKTLYYTKSTNERQLEVVKNKAMIITKDDCPYCQQAKSLFKNLNIEYIEYNLNEVTHFPWKTVPQIWFEGHYIGGFKDLAEFIEVKQKQVFNLDKSVAHYSSVECEACEA